ncbi:hypothetical protein [Alphaentomopoxvirus acuprea]|uniref:Uncharacterized protein n=1 Tax=Alphaentomopoxvirus acuprea TaxID=62099 RepID=W6JL97_9POXV|nr:hypothetical protein BA82_gp041 [Anomala cuprea entomopoxvirus]BAO49401.1 hypothetical protein [Anomala cuprea entomopoxvirus]
MDTMCNTCINNKKYINNLKHKYKLLNNKYDLLNNYNKMHIEELSVLRSKINNTERSIKQFMEYNYNPSLNELNKDNVIMISKLNEIYYSIDKMCNELSNDHIFNDIDIIDTKNYNESIEETIFNKYDKKELLYYIKSKINLYNNLLCKLKLENNILINNNKIFIIELLINIKKILS